MGHCNDEVNEALKAQIEKGTSFGAPCELEVRHTCGGCSRGRAALFCLGAELGCFIRAASSSLSRLANRSAATQPAICNGEKRPAHPAIPDCLSPLQNVLAKMVIERVPSVEMVRFVNSGTEACLSVVRLMRAYTGREKVRELGASGCSPATAY